MIRLHSDYLVFELSTGELVPCSVEEVTVELMGQAAGLLDPDLIRHAALAALHYFKFELGRTSVSVGEFSLALARVLRNLGISVQTPGGPAAAAGMAESDLSFLAQKSGRGFELGFFQLLRDEMRGQLRRSPQVLRFRGLRGCVKQIVGARRWSPRCEQLSDQIVEYLRHCLSNEGVAGDCALVVT